MRAHDHLLTSSPEAPEVKFLGIMDNKSPEATIRHLAASCRPRATIQRCEEWPG